MAHITCAEKEELKLEDLMSRRKEIDDSAARLMTAELATELTALKLTMDGDDKTTLKKKIAEHIKTKSQVLKDVMRSVSNHVKKDASSASAEDLVVDVFPLKTTSTINRILQVSQHTSRHSRYSWGEDSSSTEASETDSFFGDDSFAEVKKELDEIESAAKLCVPKAST